MSGKGQYAVWHNSRCGPWFGGGSDLYITDLSNSNTYSHTYSASYEPPNRQTGEATGLFFHGGTTSNFQTVEVEVFQIV